MMHDTPQGQTNHCPMCEDAAKKILELEHENHNLNWALGSDGYEKMYTSEEQQASDNAHAETLERIATMKKRGDRLAELEQRVKHSCWMQMERPINRYLMANAHGRQDGALKAHYHIELCSILIAVFRGKTFFETELVIHPEFAAVREATQQLTDYMDERIGFPIDARPDYDSLAPKFFEQFYALGTDALNAAQTLPDSAASPETELDKALRHQ